MGNKVDLDKESSDYKQMVHHSDALRQFYVFYFLWCLQRLQRYILVQKN